MKLSAFQFTAAQLLGLTVGVDALRQIATAFEYHHLGGIGFGLLDLVAGVVICLGALYQEVEQ